MSTTLNSPPPPPPAAPTHLLRSHSASLSALSFSQDNERLYSGDASGQIIVTSTRTLRQIASWRAHIDGILGVEEWGTRIITHARDNKLHLWARIEDLPTSRTLGGGSAVPLALPTPTLLHSMDVNALNFCRFSLLREPQGGDETALVALPNLVDSNVADVWTLPSSERIHAAIGKNDQQPVGPAGEGRNTTGIIMSLHLFSTSSSSSTSATELRLLCAYENGSVTLRKYTTSKPRSVEGKGWEAIWTSKMHVESVMAMAVSRDNRLALTVSADHLIGRYELDNENAEEGRSVHRTKHPGNSAIAIRDDGRVCAVAGWDGNIRLYSTRTLKSLGTLKYHKTACQAVAFAHSRDDAAAIDQIKGGSEDEDNEDDDEFTTHEKLERQKWLAGGGKDNRISIWGLISFEKRDT